MMEAGRLTRKRRLERIRLVKPILGRIGGNRAVILDLSLAGCRLEHHFPLRVGVETRIEFEWDGSPLEFSARVARCTFDSFASGVDGLTVYHSGLEFLRDENGSGRRLRQILEEQIVAALEEQKANARGDLPKYLDHMPIFSGPGAMAGDARTAHEAFVDQSTLLPWIRIARDRGFLCHRFDGKRWKRTRTREPKQPPEGFTVWAYEDPMQLELLEEAYEHADDEWRSFIRLCAELSLIVDDSIPPQHFEP